MNIKVLEGQTLTEVDVTRGGDEQDSIIFTTKSGAQYKMHHIQDCCEGVIIESINGDWDDLIGTTILLAEERTEGGSTHYGSETYTFYTIRTVKGSVDIRWHGESNGYYSESVDFEQIKAPELKPGEAYQLRRSGQFCHRVGERGYKDFSRDLNPEDRVEAYFIGQADIGDGFGPKNFFVTENYEYTAYSTDEPECYVESLPVKVSEPVDDSPMLDMLAKIPEPFGSKAVAYRKKATEGNDWRLANAPAGHKSKTVAFALNEGFNWAGTKEGEVYWKDVYEMIDNKNL